MEDRVLRELPPLLDSDFMYVADRRKKEFTYPIHKHEVFELNYVEKVFQAHYSSGIGHNDAVKCC